MASILIWVFLLLFVAVFALKGFVIVQEAEEMVVERMGAFNRVLHKGINFIWPIMEAVREVEWKYIRTDLNGNKVIETKTIARIDMRETVYDFPEQNVITQDNVVMKINAILYFKIFNTKDAFYEIKNLPDALEKLTQTTLRSFIGEKTLDQTLSSRDEINSNLQITLDEATNSWGVKVTRVELQNVNPPADIKNAMEKEMRAERTKRATELEAEGEKKASIYKAEGIQTSAVKIATGEAEALRLRSEAEAAAINVITEAVESSKGDPTQYLIAMRYIETFKEMVSGQNNKVIYVPYEATALLGSIGSIKELFQDNKATKTRIFPQKS